MTEEFRAILENLRRPDLAGSALTEEVRNLRQIQQQGWDASLFEGLLSHSTHLVELKRNPHHYGRLLDDHDPIDPEKALYVLLDADRPRLLELTPFAFSQLLSHQARGVPEADVRVADGVWAYPAKVDVPPTVVVAPSVAPSGRTVFAPVERLAEPPVRPLVRPKVSFTGGAAGEVKRLKLDEIEIALSWCPPGRFTMGSPLGEKVRSDNEGPVEVEHTKGFWMFQTEVTQELYEAVSGKNPSKFAEPKNPVEQVGYTEAVEFASALTKQLSKSGLLSDWEVRLPTEAQWEYAARAGTKTVFPFGTSLSRKQANFNGNYHYGEAKGPCLNKKTLVASYPANAWGLYDTVGNVREWCLDGYNNKLPGGADPFLSPERVSIRVFRGGSWSGALPGSGTPIWGSVWPQFGPASKPSPSK